MLHEIAVLLSLAVSVWLAVLQYRRWLREREAEHRKDYEEHTMASVKAESLSVATLLQVLAGVRAENDSLRTQLAQLTAEVTAHRARQENST